MSKVGLLLTNIQEYRYSCYQPWIPNKSQVCTQIYSVQDFENFEFQKGLSNETHKTSSVKCFPTYVRSLPNGQEQGKFLSLDLGGTNFRVIVMELTPHQEFLMDSKIYAIPQNIMQG